ncbi:MAG: hypothetical protein WDW38_001124 [Sanguina aurantia]
MQHCPAGWKPDAEPDAEPVRHANGGSSGDPPTTHRIWLLRHRPKPLALQLHPRVRSLSPTHQQPVPASPASHPSAASSAYFLNPDSGFESSSAADSNSGSAALHRDASMGASGSSTSSSRANAPPTASSPPPTSHEQPADNSEGSSNDSPSLHAAAAAAAAAALSSTESSAETSNGRATWNSNGSVGAGGQQRRSSLELTQAPPLPCLRTSPFESPELPLPAIDEALASCPPANAPAAAKQLSLSQVSIEPGMSAFLSQAAGYLGATTSLSVAHIAPALTSTQSPDPAGRGTAMGQPDSVRSIAKAEVKIQHSSLLNYWLVTITSKDRRKLFFDTVCTLADMHYDIFHATIDSEGESASQLFYVRPRYGECVWDPSKANKLKYMLESSVQRRFPRGLKILVSSIGRVGNLANLFLVLSSAGLWVTRAEVCAQQDNDGVRYQVTLTDAAGNLPEARAVQRTCESAGGVLGVYNDPEASANPSGGHSSNGMASRLALGSGTGRHSTLPTTGAASSGPGPKVPATFCFSFVDKAYGAAGGHWAPPASSPPATQHSHSAPMHFPLRP